MSKKQATKTRGASRWRAPSGRWQVADGVAMLAAYRASGESQRTFAETHGIGAHQVSYWKRRLSRTSGGPDGERAVFVPVRVTPAATLAGSEDEPRLEIELRNGRKLRVVGKWDVDSASLWLAALEALPC